MFQETAVNPADGLHFSLGPGHKDHPISLQAFVFARLQLGLHLAAFVKQDTAKAKYRWLDLHRFCSGQVFMLGGPLFEGHG